MDLEHARQFVQKMKEDAGFRKTVSELEDRTELWRYLDHIGFKFDECDLVKAMAECMADLERMQAASH